MGLPYSDDLEIEVVSKSETGRVIKLKINDTLFSASDVYNKLGLRSYDFSFVKKDDKVIINTCGYGHGVGMSQYGALGMALDGYSYEEILKYYYTGVTIDNIK